MMNKSAIIMDAIFEFLVFVFFSIPGAFVRWLLSGCKRPFKNFIKNGDAYLDGTIGIITIVLIFLLIKKLLL